MEFLGVIVGDGTIKMDQAKTQTIQEWPQPKSLTKMCSFLQFCNFYWYFILNFATITKPPNLLTKKNQSFVWEGPQQCACWALGDAIQDDVVLAYPIDILKYRLETNASNYAAGAILHQVHNGCPCPIGFFSRMFSPAERNYDIYEKEMLAIMLTLGNWWHLLKGAPEFEKSTRTWYIFDNHRTVTGIKLDGTVNWVDTTSPCITNLGSWTRLLTSYLGALTLKKGWMTILTPLHSN